MKREPKLPIMAAEWSAWDDETIEEWMEPADTSAVAEELRRHDAWCRAAAARHHDPAYWEHYAARPWAFFFSFKPVTPWWDADERHDDHGDEL